MLERLRLFLKKGKRKNEEVKSFRYVKFLVNLSAGLNEEEPVYLNEKDLKKEIKRGNVIWYENSKGEIVYARKKRK